VSITTQNGPQVLIFKNVSAYAQDTWKLNNRLTFTYGFRSDINPAPHEAKGNDPSTLLQITDPSTFAFAPRGTPLWKTTYNNVAPRIGVAYQLSQAKGRELVLRGGVGIFYDLGNGQASNAFALSFPFTAARNLFNEPFPLPPGDAAAPIVSPKPGVSDSLYVFDPELKLPRVYQWNFTLEQSLGTSQSLTASYVAAVGRRLLKGERMQNPGQFLGVFNIVKNNATSDYHAMQLQFHRRLARGFQAQASYTWSHSIDIASGDGAIAADIIANPRQDRGPSDFDVRHAFNGAITYNFPAPHIGTIGSKIVSGWSVDGIFNARTATPVNVTYTRTTTFGSASLRPDLVPGVPLYLDDPSVPRGRRFNNTRVTIPGNPLPQIGPFLRPTVARQGTLGRNALRGFPVWQLDLALRRQFHLTERVNLQFRAEFFNVFNHPNFGDPVASLTNSSFGVSTAMLGRSLGTGGLTGGFNPLYQVGGPRSIQCSLKLSF